jgi:hypothetical protein
MFLVAVGFCNFLGAGIFGFLVNLPIVSYYEIGTALTANHGHAAMPHRHARHARRVRGGPVHRDLRARRHREGRRRRSDRCEADVTAEVVLAAGYAGLLIVGAFVLEWLSAHTHRRSLRYRTAGFAYDEEHDHWQCPEGEHLWPQEFDHERRLVRYRAKAHVCNACPRKGACTDSDHGREIVRPLDPWPHSEAGRFHRGIALLMVGLALLIVSSRAPGTTIRPSWRCWRPARSRHGGWRATCAPTRPTSRNRAVRRAWAWSSPAPTGARRTVGCNEALGGPLAALSRDRRRCASSGSGGRPPPGVSYPGLCWVVRLLPVQSSTVVDNCCPATPIDHASAAAAWPGGGTRFPR